MTALSFYSAGLSPSDTLKLNDHTDRLDLHQQSSLTQGTTCKSYLNLSCTDIDFDFLQPYSANIFNRSSQSHGESQSQFRLTAAIQDFRYENGTGGPSLLPLENEPLGLPPQSAPRELDIEHAKQL
jgi:hypothetical protein